MFSFLPGAKFCVSFCSRHISSFPGTHSTTMADRKPLPTTTTTTYSSTFEFESSDSVNTGSRPLLPSIDSFQVSEPPQPPRSKFKALFRSTQRLAAETWQDVKRDTKSARWGRGGLWFLFSLWAIGLFAALVMVPLIAEANSNSACKPDGSFSIVGRYSSWNIDGFFQITVSVFGKLTFTEAKLIDVIWDVVRGPPRSTRS